MSGALKTIALIVALLPLVAGAAVAGALGGAFFVLGLWIVALMEAWR